MDVKAHVRPGRKRFWGQGCVGRWWMKPQGARRLLEQKTDRERRGMRKGETLDTINTPGMEREVEGPQERGVTKFKAEKGSEQKVMVHSLCCGHGGRKVMSLGCDT